jgi:hypothetical protein
MCIVPITQFQLHVYYIDWKSDFHSKEGSMSKYSVNFDSVANSKLRQTLLLQSFVAFTFSCTSPRHGSNIFSSSSNSGLIGDLSFLFYWPFLTLYFLGSMAFILAFALSRRKRRMKAKMQIFLDNCERTITSEVSNRKK